MKSLFEKLDKHPILFKEKPVLTFKMIDQLHERPLGTASRNFKENRRRFLKDEDYWDLATEDVLRRQLLELGFIGLRTPRVIVLSESGYLKVTKPMRDDRSWEIMAKLIKSYFRLRELSPQEGITSFNQIGGNLDQVIHALKSLKAYSETLAVTIQKQRETIKEQKAAIDKAAGIGSSLMTSKRVNAPKLEDPDQSVMEFMQLEDFGRRLMEKLAGAS